MLDSIHGRLKAALRVSCFILALGAIPFGTFGAAPASAAPETWSATTPLDDARSSHTATRLLGGKVLVAGGLSGGQALATAEIYDPSANAWTTTAGLATARSSHTATALPDGRVVVAGGKGAGGSPLSSAEIFNPVTGQWTPTGSLGTARSGHTATLLPNGRILVAGGVGADNRPLASAEVLTPATGTWAVTGNLTTARTSHTATVLPSGKVLVAGGTGADGQTLASAELYNQTSGTWSPTGAMSTPRSEHAATALGGEISGGTDPRVLVTGGVGADGSRLASAELYAEGSGTWTSTAPMRTARSSHTATLLPNGQVLVAGGAGANAAPQAQAELYDPGTAAWSATGALAGARSAHTATVLLSGRVLVAGGTGAGGASLDTAELYEPDLGDRWQPTGSLADARSGHTATLLPSGNVLVTGGHRTTRASTPPRTIDPLASTELYRPGSGTWTTVGPLGRARSFHTTTLLQGSRSQCGNNCGKVLVAGGVGAADPTGRAQTVASAELFDPATGTWSPTGSMTTSRALHTATLLPNGKVLVVAGAGPGGAEPRNANQLASAELYDPATGTWTQTGSLTGTTSTPATNTPRGARLGHTAVLLDRGNCGPNCGKVLVATGVGGVGTGPALSSAELYDPDTGTFTATESMNQGRQGQVASVLPDGRVLIAGGFHDPFGLTPPIVNTGELFDPATGNWSASGPLTARRYGATATLLSSGRVLVAGGSGGGNAPGFPNVPGPGLLSSELFSPQANSWTRTSFLNAGRVYHTATLLPSGPYSVCGANCGKVLVAGGNAELVGTFGPYFDLLSPLRSAELYGPDARPGSSGGGPTPNAPVSPQPQPASPFAGCPTSTANVIRGTAASNSIVGTRFGDRIFAGTGNDTVDGLAGGDCLDLGPGTDRGQGGDGGDLVVGGLGRDRIVGNDGNDRLRGGSSGDRLNGGFGNDFLHGQSGADRINGSRGRDRINGGSSNDVISAGSSSGDRVAGDQGNDLINGNSGNDLLKGNSGHDRITGSTGADRISGGSGNDRVHSRDGRRDRVNCGRGRDRVIADRFDRIARNCERVSRRRASSAAATVSSGGGASRQPGIAERVFIGWPGIL